MTKKDLLLIHGYIDQKNPKQELNFAMIDFNQRVIMATDTVNVIEFNLNKDEVEMCNGIHYLHKKQIKLIAQMMAKKEEYTFKDNAIMVNGVRFTLDNQPVDDDFNFPDTENYIRPHDFKDYSFTLDDIDMLEYDTALSNAFVLPKQFLNLQAFSACIRYGIDITPQKDVVVDGGGTRTEVGRVRVVGMLRDEVRFTFVAMGIEYVNPQPTLFNR